MANWYFLGDGQEIGPFETADLKRLADSGRLTPADKVRRSDMSQWYQAAQVKGLFVAGLTQSESTPNTAAQTAANSVVAPVIKPQTISSNATATRKQPNTPQPQPPKSSDSFSSWYATRLGQQSVVLQIVLWFVYGFIWIPLWWSASASGESANEKVKQTKRRTLIILCTLLGMCLLGALLPIIDPGFHERLEKQAREREQRQSTSAATSSPAKARVLSSFDATPQPVEDAIAAGKQVWLLNDIYPMGDFSNPKCATYIVVSGNRLEKIIGKQQVSKAIAKAMYKLDDESVVWDEWPLSKEVREGPAPSQWNFDLRTGPQNIKLTYHLTGGDSSALVTEISETTATLEPGQSVGNWFCEKTSDVKYGGALAKVPDKHEVKSKRGVAQILAPK